MLLTQKEYDFNYQHLLNAFAQAQHDQWQERVWQLQKKNGYRPVEATLLWLYVYALRNYQNLDGAFNTLQERDVMNIFARVRSFAFEPCAGQTPSLTIALQNYSDCGPLAPPAIAAAAGVANVFVTEPGDGGLIFTDETGSTNFNPES